jgi:hypothetical protein
LIYRIGGDLLTTIIVAALALACGLAAYPLLRMIRGRPKGLADSNGNGGRPSRGSGREWKGFILSGGASNVTVLAKKRQRIQKRQIFGPSSLVRLRFYPRAA